MEQKQTTKDQSLAAPQAGRRLISIQQAAELSGDNYHNMRRKLVALNTKHDGKILQSFHRKGQVRKWFVSPDALLFCLRVDPAVNDQRIQLLESKLRAHEVGQRALRRGLRKLRGDFEAERERQDRLNNAFHTTDKILAERQRA